MADASGGSVSLDTGVLQITSLFHSVPTAFGVVDADGFLFHQNPALKYLMQEFGLDSSRPLLSSWARTNGSTGRLFNSDGALKFDGLPYEGYCYLSDHLGKRVPATLKLDAYHNAAGQPTAAFCTILPEVASRVEPSSGGISQWCAALEMIGDSFDENRIAQKTCDLLLDSCEATGAVFFWLTGNEWCKAHAAGDYVAAGRIPARFGVENSWVESVINAKPIRLSELSGVRSSGSGKIPTWVTRAGDGFILACHSRDDCLGLVFVWGSCPRLSDSNIEDLLLLVGSQAALAIEHARWFRMAHRSDSRNSALIENANALIIGVDLRGNITLWNQKAQEILGYSQTETLGRSVINLFSEDDKQAAVAKKRFGQMLNNPQSMNEFEIALLDKQGLKHHIIWSTSVLNSGNDAVLGLYAIGQDLTRRKMLEERLRDSELRYRTFVETTHDIYWMIRVEPGEDLENGEVTFLNHAFAGNERDALVGESVTLFKQSFSEQSWKVFDSACHSAMDSGDPVLHLETTHITPDSDVEDAFLRTDIFPCLESGKLVGVQGLSSDVSDQKVIENQMLRAQKMESVGTLARGISHDFSNIINGISGFVYLIQQGVESMEKVLKHSYSIQELCKRGGGLTRQLQTYVNESRPEKRPLDMNALIRQSMQILQTSINPAVQLELQLSDTMDWIEADRSQIEQVVMNLCINASEAMPDGGTLSVTTRPVKYEKNGKGGDSRFDVDEGCYCMIRVQDTGTGMKPEVRDRVFDPFFTTKETGNGLGLSAVYGVIQNHHAHVRVESEPGQGTCFTIIFPAIEKKQVLVGDLKEGDGLRGGNETILIADDEEPIRLVAADILTTMGYRVICAASGEKAIDIFRERPQAIHLVLMDFHMPGLNGRATAKAMRVLRPDLKVLFTSGFSDASQVEALRAAGFQHFLAKPYSMFNLQKAVRHVLDIGQQSDSESELTIAQ